MAGSTTAAVSDLFKGPMTRAGPVRGGRPGPPPPTPLVLGLYHMTGHDKALLARTENQVKTRVCINYNESEYYFQLKIIK
jgi:hypothetical protein